MLKSLKCLQFSLTARPCVFLYVDTLYLLDRDITLSWILIEYLKNIFINKKGKELNQKTFQEYLIFINSCHSGP